MLCLTAASSTHPLCCSCCSGKRFYCSHSVSQYKMRMGRVDFKVEMELNGYAHSSHLFCVAEVKMWVAGREICWYTDYIVKYQRR